MTIRDRGKIKWQSAAFLPEHTAMLKEMNRDTLKLNYLILYQRNFYTKNPLGIISRDDFLFI